jgi:hypothetical protein
MSQTKLHQQEIKVMTLFPRTNVPFISLFLAVAAISFASTARAADGTNAVPAAPPGFQWRLVPIGADTTNAAPAAPPGPEVTGRHKTENFWKRFDDAEMEALSTPAYVAPPPVPPGSNAAPQANRRGHETPFDAPPFPDGEWQIGGTEIIGDQNLTPDFPLMQALYDGPHGQWWRDTRIKLYGWEDFSGNLSTSHNTDGANTYSAAGDPTHAPQLSTITGAGANFPLAYDQLPNQLTENQFVLYLERTPDEFQTDHPDWGFRMSWVYGLDYRYMISRGWDDAQLTRRNNIYGMDTPMMYANLYIPKVAEGLNLTFGRIISEADIEAQLAPNNLMSSHSLLYAYDPYCQWGLFGTLKLNDCWTVQAGASAGNDVTPWETQDPGCQPTAAVMLQYQSPDNKFSFYGGGNCINNAHWGFNNIQQYVGTLSYKFNDRIWTSHETWYMFQTGCPGQPSKIHPFGVAAADEPAGQNFNPNGAPVGNPGYGAFGYSDGEIPVHPGFAAEWATLNYTMIRLAPNTFFTIRNELFNDMDGERTAYATLYSEHSIGLTWWPCKVITIRPELRYDHSYGTHGSPSDLLDEAKPFDNGTRRQQFTAQFDVIYSF